MKTKKLPKRKNEFATSEDAKKQSVKLNKQKRAKKPSIYDEMSDDDYENSYNSGYDRDDYYNDYDYDKDENEDYY